MSFQSVNAGGMIDVGSRIGENLHYRTLLGNPSLGNNTNESPVTLGYNASVRPVPRFGDWYKVPDENVFMLNTVRVLGLYRIIWELNNGSTVEFGDGEVRYTVPFFGNILRGSRLVLENVYVKLTRNTAPGLVAFGLISQVEADNLVRVNEQNQPPAPPSTGEVVQTSMKGIVVIAVIGALIWFLPKNVVRG